MTPTALLAKVREIRGRKPASSAPEALTAAPAAEAQAAPAQAPRKVKLKNVAASQPVTRQEFDALTAQLHSFRTIASVALAAVGMALQGSPGLPDANFRTRLGLLAAAADLDSQARTELQALFKLLAGLDKVESARQMEETRRRSAPRTFENSRIPSWRG
jgi:hypothetical protein